MLTNQKKKLLVGLVLLSLFLVACSSSNQSKNPGDTPQPICVNTLTTGFCDINGNFIASECELKTGVATAAYLGTCDSNVTFAGDYRACSNSAFIPVCSKKGITFANECFLRSANETLDYVGTCESTFDAIPKSTCSGQIDFVCTSRRITFQNECFANEQGYIVSSRGKCTAPAMDADCLEVKVVCGVNNVTFGSACMAQKRGIAVAHEGSC